MSRMLSLVLLLLLVIGCGTCMDNLVTDGCIVHSDLTLETFQESMNLGISYRSEDDRPFVAVELSGGLEDKFWFDFLPSGKWSNVVLKLGNNPDLIRSTDDRYTTIETGAQESVVKRSKLRFKNTLVYINCPTNTPNFELGYYTARQLPRTGKAREEVLLLPPLPSNVFLEVLGINLVICKVQGRAVVKTVANVSAQCSSLNADKQLKLILGFPQDNKKMELAISGQDPISVNITNSADSLKFTQPVRGEKMLYIQCPDSCHSSDVSATANATVSASSYAAVSIMLAIFVIFTVALIIFNIFIMNKIYKFSKPNRPNPGGCIQSTVWIIQSVVWIVQQWPHPAHQPQQQGQVEERSELHVDPEGRIQREEDTDDTA